LTYLRTSQYNGETDIIRCRRSTKRESVSRNQIVARAPGYHHGRDQRQAYGEMQCFAPKFPAFAIISGCLPLARPSAYPLNPFPPRFRPNSYTNCIYYRYCRCCISCIYILHGPGQRSASSAGALPVAGAEYSDRGWAEEPAQKYG